MKIIITEEQKKKLFIPRKLSGEESRWADWNKMQPIVDGVRINQYDINTGKKEGIWEEYYDNGQLMSKGSFKDDKRDGIWESYYGNGQLVSKGSFKDDKRDGIWEWYHSNGQLESKGSYKNDKPDGIWEWYYDNGNLNSKGSYKNGLMDGIWEYYRDNGNLNSKGSYKDGKLIKKLTESEQPKNKLFMDMKKIKITEQELTNIINKVIQEDENPKKGKLFIPRNIDERKEQLNNEIKKFLNSIKDSFIWDFIGEISVSYNFESDYEDISYNDINGNWLDMHRIGMKPYNILIEKYGEEKAKEMTIEFNKISDKIQDFVIALLDNEGYTVVYAWGEIINHGNGKLEYKEHRTRKIEQMDYRVVSL